MMHFHLFLCIIGIAHALYGPSSDVIMATDKNFKDEVLKHAGIVVVEFFAPWCGHCKSLTPEYEKAASALKGIVKIVAVDATVSESLAQKYAIQGFPTLKVFGGDKKSPIDYQGARTADGIIKEAMKSANQLVKDRKNGGGGGGSAGGKKSTSSSGSGSHTGSKKGGSEVIELTEANFDALVLQSSDQWLVEFFAPWCGHCKNLAPEWETAAKNLKGSVKLGAVDATVHGSLAQKYGVKGYPTIKVFSAGKKSGVQDYNGPREAAGITQYALDLLERSGVPPNTPQITDLSTFSDLCAVSGKVCGIMFVPHIFDSGAVGRNTYLETLLEVAKAYRSQPIVFGWVEGTAQESLESILDINNVYPTIALLSVERKVFAVQRVSWSLKNIKAFVNGVLSGSERKSSLTSVPTIVTTIPWDGKDAQPVQEDYPLDDLMSEE